MVNLAPALPAHRHAPAPAGLARGALRAVIAACMLFAMPGVALCQPLAEDAWRADLLQFEREFFDRDRAFTAEARQQAQARLVSLRAQTGPLGRAQLQLELAQIAALADNGHSAVLPMPRADAGNRVPIRLAPFGTEFRVLRAMAPDHDLLGTRLAAIDGHPLAALREAAHRLQGGTAAWRDRSAPFLFESPEQLHTLGLARAPDAAEYRFERDDGSSLTRRLVAQPPSPTRPRASTDRLLLPEVTPDQDGWRGLLTLRQAPWVLQDAGQRLRWRAMPELGALHIEMRAIADSPTMRLPAFFDDVRAAIAQHQPRHLVLDLRHNGGGDLTRARDFAESLPTLVPGRLFVLTSAWTFSAAISTGAYLKQAAPARVTLVGEEAGDRLEFFAEGRATRLAHSGAVVLPATERHDYAGGCQDFTDCHAPVLRRPIRLKTLAPELQAPWTFEAWRAGVDPAFAAVTAALARAAP